MTAAYRVAVRHAGNLGVGTSAVCEAVAQALDFEAYRVCAIALIEGAIDDAARPIPEPMLKP